MSSSSSQKDAATVGQFVGAPVQVGAAQFQAAAGDVAELVRIVARGARPQDVVLVMSNGAFGGFIPSLLSALREQA